MLLDDIEQWLVHQGVGDFYQNLGTSGLTGWPICKGFIPPEPDQVIGLFETPGEAPDIISKTVIGEQSYDVVGLQVRMRGAVDGYRELRSQLQLVYKALHQNEPNVTSGQDYIFIYASNPAPLPMGKDSNNRDELVMNFLVMMRRQ